MCYLGMELRARMCIEVKSGVVSLRCRVARLNRLA